METKRYLFVAVPTDEGANNREKKSLIRSCHAIIIHSSLAQQKCFSAFLKLQTISLLDFAHIIEAVEFTRGGAEYRISLRQGQFKKY